MNEKHLNVMDKIVEDYELYVKTVFGEQGSTSFKEKIFVQCQIINRNYIELITGKTYLFNSIEKDFEIFQNVNKKRWNGEIYNPYQLFMKRYNSQKDGSNKLEKEQLEESKLQVDVQIQNVFRKHDLTNNMQVFFKTRTKFYKDIENVEKNPEYKIKINSYFQKNKNISKEELKNQFQFGIRNGNGLIKIENKDDEFEHIFFGLKGFDDINNL